MPVNIFITGHRGYIGSALIKLLQDQYNLDTIRGYDIIDGVDILDLDTLTTAMRFFNPYIVIHLAAISSGKNITQSVKVNSIGTRNVLTAMKASDCQHIIYASTSEVYGNNERLPFNEKMVPKPISPYGMSKLLGEHAIYNHYEINKNIGDYLIFRLFEVVGSSGFESIDAKYQPGYNSLFQGLESGKVIIHGNDYSTFDGTCERDYVALKDTCEAFVIGIKTIMTTNIRETINICSGRALSIESVILTWNNLHVSDMLSATYSYEPRKEDDSDIVYGSNIKAQKIINWFAKRKIEDIICDLAQDKKFNHGDHRALV